MNGVKRSVLCTQCLLNNRPVILFLGTYLPIEVDAIDALPSMLILWAERAAIYVSRSVITFEHRVPWNTLYHRSSTCCACLVRIGAFLIQ